jgi:hypothetical protein
LRFLISTVVRLSRGNPHKEPSRFFADHARLGLQWLKQLTRLFYFLGV